MLAFFQLSVSAALLWALINQISLPMISRTLSISFLEAEILGFRCMVQMIHKIISKYDVYVVY